ncbi:MAG: HXXEE domain-containing protein [Pseudomonadota bacterium]
MITSDRAATGMLIVAFAMLWVPLGQHTFLTVHWMKVGTFMAPLLLLIAFTFRSDGELLSNPRMLSLLLLVAYIVHQFEEHWVDLYGRTYAFKPYLNEFLSTQMGYESSVEFMSDSSVFVINTSLVWLVGALAIWRGSAHIFTTLCMAAIVVVNAISHIVAGAVAGGYNPGLLSAVVIFLPLGIAVYGRLLLAGAATRRLVIASLIWGLFAHALLIGGILAMNQYDWLPEAVYFVILVAWSILPAFAFPEPRLNPRNETSPACS